MGRRPQCACGREARSFVIRIRDGRNPTWERIRDEFPFPTSATEAHALGDVRSRLCLDDRERQIAAVSAMAALLLTDGMALRAGHALNLSVTEDGLNEVVDLVQPCRLDLPAIGASQSLSDLFAERSRSKERAP